MRDILTARAMPASDYLRACWARLFPPPDPRPYFWCADCGRTRVDEDGCCRACGRDADVRPRKD